MKKSDVSRCDDYHQAACSATKEASQFEDERSRDHATNSDDQSLCASPSSSVPQTSLEDKAFGTPVIPAPSLFCISSDDDTFGSPGSSTSNSFKLY